MTIRKDNKRHFNLYLTQQVRYIIDEAAELSGQTATDIISSGATEKAMEIIKTHADIKTKLEEIGGAL